MSLNPLSGSITYQHMWVGFVFFSGRLGEAYEDDDAVAAGVARLWIGGDVEVRFPVVHGPDVAGLVDATVGHARERGKTRGAAFTVERFAAREEHRASGRGQSVARRRGNRVPRLVTRGKRAGVRAGQLRDAG